VKVAITGASGFIGTALGTRLEADGHAVLRVGRGPAGTGRLTWDPEAGRLDGAELEGLDAVVNLAGAGLAAGRWTAPRRHELRASRIASTRLLSRTLAALDRPPPVLLSASAVGYYGDRGEDELIESSPAGTGFLAELCRDWEAETAAAAAAGIRVVCLRTGIVLARSGGALARQLPLFRLGLGGRLGSGRQVMSWISLADEVGAILFAIAAGALRGPANVVGPAPVTNAAFTATLGRVLRRPARLPVPAVALRAAFGAALADEALLAGQRVVPAALLTHGYRFEHRTVEAALRAALA
jgi:uncharacterized protein (TIGR01777 family)